MKSFRALETKVASLIVMMQAMGSMVMTMWVYGGHNIPLVSTKLRQTDPIPETEATNGVSPLGLCQETGLQQQQKSGLKRLPGALSVKHD